MKVLIIDDEPLVRAALARVFKKKKAIVFEAEDGQQGLELIKSENPDLIFLDVLMPKMNGFEVLAQIEENSKIKVVMMSAHTGNQDLQNQMKKKIDLFIQKPFEDIFALVQKAEELIK